MPEWCVRPPSMCSYVLAEGGDLRVLGKDIPEGYTLVDDQMRTRVTVR